MKNVLLFLVVTITTFQIIYCQHQNQQHQSRQTSTNFFELNKKPLDENNATLENNSTIEDDGVPSAPRHYDSALVLFYNRVFNQSSGTFAELDVWGNSANCFQCLNIKLLKKLNGTLMQSFVVSTQYPFTFEIRLHSSPNDTSLSNFTYHYDEYGVYQIEIKLAPSADENDDNSTNTNTNTTQNISTTIQKRDKNGAPLPPKIQQVMTILTPGQNAFLPILYAFIGFLSISIAYIVYSKFFKRRVHKFVDAIIQTLKDDHGLSVNVMANTSSEMVDHSIKPKKSGRVVAIDAFRGMCLVVMIFANYDGGHYYFFNHSTWNGLTVADLVFPWFIFIMGTAIPISLHTLERQRVTKWTLLYKIVRRSVILFGLGLFLNNGFDLQHWRIPGVLQRFGVSYLFTALIVAFIPILKLKERGRDPNKKHEGGLLAQKVHPFGDIFPFALQWIVAGLFPLIHTIVTFVLPVPGCPTGYLGPGGLGDFGMYSNCTGGAARYVDIQIFGLQHIYQSPTCKSTYHTGAYDPEGGLGYLTSIFLCFLGVQVGRTLLTYNAHVARLGRFSVWAVLLGVPALVLTLASQNVGWIPINKNLWSLSFILAMASMGYIALIICYLIIDVFDVWDGTPFVFPGANSIVVYFGSEILQGFFPFSFKPQDPNNPTHSEALASSLIGVSCWVVISYYMWWIGFFINI